jgi:hypothetical protein
MRNKRTMVLETGEHHQPTKMSDTSITVIYHAMFLTVLYITVIYHAMFLTVLYITDDFGTIYILVISEGYNIMREKYIIFENLDFEIC